MRIACLQFAPQLAETDRNVERADAILDRADPQDIDLLVLPELAFSGYNFKSLRHISPHLERAGTGITAAWSRQAARKYGCAVVAGYPEEVDPVRSWPADPEYYNSAIIIDGDGNVVGNYRKSHLYYTDETWALQGRDGFFTGHVRGLGQLGVGICMDINPYKFEAPWDAYEFSSHAVETGARLIVLSMAWCTNADQEEFFVKPNEPDMDTLLYWITRLQPIVSIDSSQETIIVFGNRCGAEGDATYVGTSTVIGVKSGEISLYGILGRGEESLLVVDTDAQPYAKIKLQSGESVQAQNQVEHDSASQSLPQTDPSDKQGDARGSESRATNGTEPNQATTTDVRERTLDTIKVTKEAEGNSHYGHHWLEPSRRPREHPANGPFRVDGSSVGLASCSSHISYTQFTQSHVAPPATQQHDMGEMRPTMSDADYQRNCMHGFSESDDELLLLYDSCAESEEEGWPCPQESQLRGAERYRVAASTQREHGVSNVGKRLPITHQSQPGLPSPQSEQGATSQSSLVHRTASFALAHQISPTPNTEDFKEEDIYRHVHGKDLTSEHHIRYHTHLLREKRARPGFSTETEDQENDQEDNQEECQKRERNEIGFETDKDYDESRQPGRPNLELASPTGVRAGLETQPNYTHESVTEPRQPAWQEHPEEPTPIVDSPMSHMTLFSPTRTRRRRHTRQAPAYATAVPGRADAVAMESSMDVDERAVNQERLPVLGRSEAKENSIPLLDPSRRPKAAARQVPPLRLVPREASQGKEREVGERSRRTLPTAREMKRPMPRDSGGHKDRHMGRKTPVPMVLVYEGEERVYSAS